MMTPEQQADYDYAMSQLKPKTIILSRMPMLQLNVDSKKWEEAIKQATIAAYKLGASMRFAMSAPNCRCVIKNNWEDTSKKEQ